MCFAFRYSSSMNSTSVNGVFGIRSGFWNHEQWEITIMGETFTHWVWLQWVMSLKTFTHWERLQWVISHSRHICIETGVCPYLRLTSEYSNRVIMPGFIGSKFIGGSLLLSASALPLSDSSRLSLSSSSGSSSSSTESLSFTLLLFSSPLWFCSSSLVSYSSRSSALSAPWSASGSSSSSSSSDSPYTSLKH